MSPPETIKIQYSSFIIHYSLFISAKRALAGSFLPYIEESFSRFSAGGERNPQRVGEKGLCVATLTAAGSQYHGEEQPDDGGIDGGGHGA